MTTKKLFIVRKFIFAISAKDAIKKDKSTPPDDVYVDEDWKRNNLTVKQEKLGFK